MLDERVCEALAGDADHLDARQGRNRGALDGEDLRGRDQFSHRGVIRERRGERQLGTSRRRPAERTGPRYAVLGCDVDQLPPRHVARSVLMKSCIENSRAECEPVRRRFEHAAAAQ